MELKIIKGNCEQDKAIRTWSVPIVELSTVHLCVEAPDKKSAVKRVIDWLDESDDHIEEYRYLIDKYGVTEMNFGEVCEEESEDIDVYWKEGISDK